MPLPYPSPTPRRRPAFGGQSGSEILNFAFKTHTFSTFPLSSITDAHLAAIIRFDLLYEADSAPILPGFLLYEADFGAMLQYFLPYEADHTAILLPRAFGF